MEFAVKNIILYDMFGSVVGFAEFKIRRDRADVKCRHNLNEKNLTLSVVANGEAARNFEISGVQSLFEIRGRIDAEKEIFVYINKGGETLASGVVNEARVCHSEERSDEESQVRTDKSASTRDSSTSLGMTSGAQDDMQAIKELDEAIRKLCIIDENGKGQCETCPYREHFFGGAIEEDEVVV